MKIGKSFGTVEFGYTTLTDLTGLYPNEKLRDTLTYDCPHTDKCSDFYGEINSVYIQKMGVLFQANYDDGEIIKEIHLYEPFIGSLGGKINVELGQTTVEDIYEKFSDLRLTSTNTKDYWIIKANKISFLVDRLPNDNEYPIQHTEIIERKIKCIILEPNRDLMTIDFEDNCRIPLFAPRTETHQNCYTKKHKGFLYYFNFSGESSYKSVKHGYWREYYPNHLIRQEGTYEKGKKTGLFKYYDKTGKLIMTKEH